MEIWDAYLRDGTCAGRDLVRGEPIPEGLYHLTGEVLVRHADGDYLLMQRSPEKRMFPGYYEATAGGSALKGEDGITCAKRELAEETGLVADTLEQIGHYISHNTIYESFLATVHGNKSAVVPQKGETVGYKWVTEAEFIAFVSSDAMIPTQRARYAAFLAKMKYLKKV